MPLPCVEEFEEEQHSHDDAISRAVVQVVKQGMEEDRVTCGIQPCVQLMASGPDNVMLCLLVQLSATLDAAIKIPLLLIRAFCQENAIDLLQVQGENKMAQLLAACLDSQSAKSVDVDILKKPLLPFSSPAQQDGASGGGVGCVMIKYPKHDTSFEDDLVADYIKEKMQNYTDPSVTIPDLTQAGVDKNLGFKLKSKKKMKTPIQASTCQPAPCTLLSGVVPH